MKKHLSFCLFLASILFFTSCKKESNPDTVVSNQYTTTTSLDGFGDRPGTPSGYLFYLPFNVRITTPMIIFDSAASTYPRYGVGVIYAIFTLENLGNNAATIQFPAGLIFLPDNDSSQSGMTLKTVRLTLPPNGIERIRLKFACINKNKNYFTVNYFTMSVVSNNNQVETLINALKNKNDSVLFNHDMRLQEIVYDISDGNGLTQADLDSIQSW